MEEFDVIVIGAGYGGAAAAALLAHSGRRVALIEKTALAGGKEFSNGCKGTADDPCIRSGFCSIQNSDWDQTVTAYRNVRPDYVKSFWELVNWEFVARNFAG